uniref:FYVE-type domain-containing protein n=1 Tax=Phytophthora ramorum TaxID=164328 RepID=H3GUQ2_PHYRM
MKFTLPENAFPAVNLSKEQQDALIQEAEEVVRETLAANEAFLAAGSTFPSSKWRLVRAKDGLNVYRERPTSQALGKQQSTDSSSPTSQTSSRSTDPCSSGRARSDQHTEVSSSSSAIDKNPLMRRPVMVLHGTVDGSLDDCMFGTFASTDEAWKWRSSHINDRLDDARILATIRKPTCEDPFQFLGIKWFAKERPAVLSSIMQQRDYLIMEATGLTRDSKGNKIGYYLMHSISLPGIIPELTDLGIIRAKLSLCFVDRQSGPGKVEKYCRNYSDPGGKIVDRVAAAVGAEALISASRVVDYAYVKKLTWLMKHKSQKDPPARRESGFPRPKRCETCFKSFTMFALNGGAACQICRRVVCAKCSVVKKMTVDVSSTGAVKQCALRFCLNCLMEAKDQSVWEMALSGVETASETSSATGSGWSR